MSREWAAAVLVVLGGLATVTPAWSQGTNLPPALGADRPSLAVGVPLADVELAPPPAMVPPPAPVPEVVPPPPPVRSPFRNVFGTPPPTPFTPFMLGDFVGPVANMFSDVKVAECESPLPLDRVYYRFNFFNNLDKARWADPTEPIHNVQLYQNVFGVEKTLIDGWMSIGLRVPFYTLQAEGKDFFLAPVGDCDCGAVLGTPGGPGFTNTEFGNIAAVVKAVLFQHVPSGSVLSMGATLTLPTASSREINPGMSTLTFIQPFAGYILTNGTVFLQGFTSVTMPLARAQSIVLFNDVGVGFWAYRNPSPWSVISGVAPTFEVHVATPLRQADPNVDLFGISDGLRVHNVVDLTLGATVEFFHHGTLGLGVAAPLTGPKPFDVEALAQLNFRF